MLQINFSFIENQYQVPDVQNYAKNACLIDRTLADEFGDV